jgi:adenosine deaminase
MNITVSCRAHQGKMKVKLLLSIDRRQGVAEAEHTVQLACQARERHPTLIAGLDLSGDPTAGAFKLFLPSLSAARTAGFGIAVHYAEVFFFLLLLFIYFLFPST